MFSPFEPLLRLLKRNFVQGEGSDAGRYLVKLCNTSHNEGKSPTLF